MICNIQDPITREAYSEIPQRRPQSRELSEITGLADTARFGPEAEFFVFDDVRFDQNDHEGYYHIDSIEGEWNRGRNRKRKTPPTKFASKRAIFRPSGRQIKKCGTRSCTPCSTAGWTWRPSIMRSPPPAKAKSICGLDELVRWPNR